MALQVNAEIYKWTDEQGNTHFGDKPPLNINSKEVKVKVNSYEAVDVIYSPDWFYKAEKKTGVKQVVMYSTSWCGVCKKAKRYFNKNKIAFREYDIEKSGKGKADYKKLKGTGVPVILIDKYRMNGFSKSRFKKIYYN